MIKLRILSRFDFPNVAGRPKPVDVMWFARERYAFEPPSKMTVSQWATDRRMLQAGVSRQPGPWSNEMTPYLIGPMDAYNDDHVRHLVLCFGTQLGKTETLYNLLGFVIDQDPYSTLLVYPREDDSKTVSRTRIQPMIEDCSSLRAKKPMQQDRYQLLEMHFPGMILYMVGANSPAALAQKPCRNVFRDEIDKYPEKVGKDADPLSLSEERAKSFWDIRKIVDVSSPTLESVGIWKQLQSCDVIRSFMVPCPHCGEYQKLKFAQVKWDKSADGNESKAQAAKTTARYECQACREPIKDDHKLWMLQNGRWEDETKNIRPTKVGFQLSSLYSPWLTWGDIAEKYLKALEDKEEKQSNEPLQNFINGWLAEPWVPYGQERSHGHILQLADDRPMGLVPSEGVLGITAGIDTQDNGFFYVIRAWGSHEESWLIREGFMDDFDALLQVIGGQFRDCNDREYIVNMAFQDAMGHRTAEVYEKLRGVSQVKPIKGEQRMASRYSVTKIDLYPGTNKPIMGGLSLYRLNTTYYKDKLFSKLNIAPADPGAFHLHGEVREDYARQMTAEYRDDSGAWICPKGRPNHYWDCEVIALAAADILGIRDWKPVQKTTMVATPLMVDSRNKWLQPSSQWLRR